MILWHAAEAYNRNGIGDRCLIVQGLDAQDVDSMPRLLLVRRHAYLPWHDRSRLAAAYSRAHHIGARYRSAVHIGDAVSVEKATNKVPPIARRLLRCTSSVARRLSHVVGCTSSVARCLLSAVP